MDIAAETDLSINVKKTMRLIRVIQPNLLFHVLSVSNKRQGNIKRPSTGYQDRYPMNLHANCWIKNVDSNKRTKQVNRLPVVYFIKQAYQFHKVEIANNLKLSMKIYVALIQ